MMFFEWRDFVEIILLSLSFRDDLSYPRLSHFTQTFPYFAMRSIRAVVFINRILRYYFSRLFLVPSR